MESTGYNLTSTLTCAFLTLLSQTCEQLKKEIQTHEIIEEAGIEYINVLLVGECSAGKSSFFNSVESVFEGYVTNTAEAGTDDGSLTKQVDQGVIYALQSFLLSFGSTRYMPTTKRISRLSSSIATQWVLSLLKG